MIAADQTSFHQTSIETSAIAGFTWLARVASEDVVTMSALMRRTPGSLRRSSSKGPGSVMAEHKRYIHRDEIARVFGAFAGLGSRA